jgi:hypothetical protein
MATVAVLLYTTDTGAQNPAAYGVVTGGAFTASHQAAVADLNVGAVRMDFYWDDVEPTRGNPNWAKYDGWVSGVGNRTILASLHRAPAWGAPCPYCVPYEGEWKHYIDLLLSHYSANTNIVWGIWNEPNLSGFGGLSAATYGQVFRWAAEQRDVTNYNARLAGPETSSGVTAYFNDAMNVIRPYMHSTDVVTLQGSTALWWSGTLTTSPGFTAMQGDDGYARISRAGRLLWIAP